MVVSGGYLFLVENDPAVAVINTSTNAIAQLISGSAYQFTDPDAIAVSGGDLFVANAGSGSLTELPV
jgi:hypothetical protein